MQGRDANRIYGTNDDIVYDPDYFRKISLSRKQSFDMRQADKIVASLEGRYKQQPVDAASFFAPAELLDDPGNKSEVHPDSDADNHVHRNQSSYNLFIFTDASFIDGSESTRPVPMLNVLEPTPPGSPNSVAEDDDATPSPRSFTVKEVEQPVKNKSRVSWGEDQILSFEISPPEASPGEYIPEEYSVETQESSSGRDSREMPLLMRPISDVHPASGAPDLDTWIEQQAYGPDVQPLIASPALPAIRSQHEICGVRPDHQVHFDLQPNLFAVVDSLGHGSLGVVEEVRVSQQYPSFVRKRVQLPLRLRKQRLQIIKEEAEALRSLDHMHIVKMIGSYQEQPPSGRQFYSLLMYPVGQSDLAAYLETLGEMIEDGQDSQDLQSLASGKDALRKWFSCLACALAYMHGQGIRHQDIKPSNIIVRHRQNQHEVYFTDFSSSARFDIGATTSTDNPARTSAMYSAPEVIESNMLTSKHGRGTDVFALGAVYCEMLAVVRGSSVHQFRDSLREYSASEEAKYAGLVSSLFLYGRLRDQIETYFTGDAFFWACVRGMLAHSREDRPDANSVATTMASNMYWVQSFCPCYVTKSTSLQNLS